VPEPRNSRLAIDRAFEGKGGRVWATADRRFTVRAHPFEQGLLIEAEHPSLEVARAVFGAGLDFHARNISAAQQRLLEIYGALGLEV
jgi:hypothetical protein